MQKEIVNKFRRMKISMVSGALSVAYRKFWPQILFEQQTPVIFNYSF